MKHIELVYHAPTGEWVHVCLPYQPEMTVSVALVKSAIPKYYPAVSACPAGVFSKVVSGDSLLKPGDRVEWYHPLTVDPKQKRKARVKPL